MPAEITLWTYQDAVEHLLDLFSMDRNNRNLRQARRAVIAAYRDIWNKYDWAYARQRVSITTTASYATGTVVYDHTGGASERLLTFTGSTLPSDFAFGVVMLGGKHYEVESRLGNTTGTLSVNSNPGADVASTTFTWYRDSYPLPVGTRKLGRPVEVASAFNVLEPMTPAEMLIVNRGYVTTGWPFYYGYARDRNYTGQLAIMFSPPPSAARTYDVFGQFGDGKQIHTERYTTGTVSTSTTTVTGVGTTWSAKMIGSVIRFGSAASVPTSAFGDVDDVDSPFVAQRIVTGVATTTSLTIDEALTTELSAVKYAVSDLIDIEEAAMLTAFLRHAEAEMSMMTNATQNTIDRRIARASSALRDACAADNRRAATVDDSGGYGWRLRDIGQLSLDA